MVTLELTDWEGKLQNGNGKTPTSQTQPTFCNSMYTFYHRCVSFPYKLYKCTERSGWNRVFMTVTGSSGETQVSAEAGGTADTKTMKFQQ